MVTSIIKYTLAIIVVFTWFVSTVFVTSSVFVGAQESAIRANMPFGGVLVMSKICCNGIKLTIYDYLLKSPITLMYQPGYSMLYSYFNIMTPGVYLLGTYTPFGFCLTIKSECEYPDITIGTIDFMPGAGTSAVPGRPAN